LSNCTLESPGFIVRREDEVLALILNVGLDTPDCTFHFKGTSPVSLIKLMKGILSGVTKRLLLGTINIFLPM
jgi:hypothetical protein